MLPTDQQHPGAESIHAFGLGRLSPSEALPIEQHVLSCPVCCNQLREVPDDALIASVRQIDRQPAQGTTVSIIASPTTYDEEPPQALLEHPRYRIVERLGRGGMGVVYRAEHRMMDRTVALKVIHPRLLNHATAVARFHQEVRAAARLSDEHIVRAYDAEQVDGAHFLVMEYVDGESLDRVIMRKGKLPPEEACEYARQVAMGLAAANSQQMVHRDIKPQNVMVDSSGRVKILDFGLARFVMEQNESPESGITSVHLLLGTPDYMAPEQAKDPRKTDTRADIYSLGCTLYHMLAGRPPFPGGTAIEKLAMHLQSAPEPLREIRGDVSDELVNLVQRMMARAPEDRVQSPEEIVQALESIPPSAPPLPVSSAAADTLVHVSAPTIAERVQKGKSRKRTSPLLVAIGLGALAVLAAIAIAIPFALQDNDDTPSTEEQETTQGETPATPLNDQFTSAELDSAWQVLDPQTGLIEVQDGSARLTPNRQTSWFNEDRGMFVYQEISGDFVVTADVAARSASQPSLPPSEIYNSGGLVARDPNSTPTTEQWLMVSVGYQADWVGSKVEPTADSRSAPQFFPSRVASGQLRMARIGKTFYLLQKLDGETAWTLRLEHRFPAPLPPTLQVGLAANAYEKADVTIEFDTVHCFVPASQDDIYQD